VGSTRRADYSPARRTIVRALIGVLVAIGVLGFAVERTLAYTVDSLSGPNSATNVVYGNWIETPFCLQATVSGSESTGISWSATNLPPNTSADFRGETDSCTGATAQHLFVTQTEGTPGPDVDSYTITVTATGSETPTPSTQSKTVQLVVQQRPVKVLGTFDIADKTYDDSTAATISANSLSLQPSDDDDIDAGIIDGDDVSLDAVATFASADVGTRSATLGASSLSGDDAANYSLDLVDDVGESYTVPTASAVISAKPLSLEPSSLTFSKTYDGELTISPTGTPTIDTAGLEGDDGAPTVSGSPTWQLDNANVGTGKTVSIASGSYLLSDSNYSLQSPTFSTAEVTQATLTVNFSTTSRPYDGGTDVTDQTTITGYTGRASSDSSVTASFTSAAVASAAVGTHVVTLSGLTLNSAQAEANYLVQAQSGVTGEITQKTLTLGGSLSATAGEYDKTYDGTDVATGDTSGLSLVGIVGADSVTISSAALSFEQAATGEDLAVNVSAVTLGGDDKDNYQVSVSAAPSATGDISAFELTVSATASAKTYDGDASASVTCTLNTFADGLGVSADCSEATFDNGGQVVLSGSTPQAHDITVSNITLSNNSAGNYTLSSDPFTLSPKPQAVINPATLTISGLSGADKTYDGTAAASVSGTPALEGVKGSDDVTLDSSAAAFAFGSKAVGNNRLITVTGYELGGTAADNYTLTQPNTLRADITAKSVTVTVEHSGRVYNSTTNVDQDNLTFTIPGKESDDVVSVSFDTAVFDSEDASQTASDFREVSVSGITITGADAGNYVLSATSASDSEVIITKRPLTIGAPSFDYRGSATGTATFELTSREWDDSDETELVFVCDDEGTSCLEDDVDVTVSGSFDEQYVHTGPFTFTDVISVDGSDASNYEYTLPTSPVTGEISTRSVGVSGLSASSGKVYDASTSADDVISGTGTLSSALATSDGVSLTGSPTFTYVSMFVGSNIQISTSGFGLSGADVDKDGNPEFSVVQPTFFADITVRTVTIGGTFTAEDKVYDTTTTATIDQNNLTLSGIHGSDSVSLNTPTVRFASADANESTPTTVNISSASLSDTDIDNDGTAEYSLSLSDSPTTTATISRYDLDPTLSVTVSNKTYDSTTAATISSASVTDLAGDDVTLASGYSGVFVSEDVGVNIDVTLSGLALEGTKKDNYSLSSTATVEDAADITAAPLTIVGITTSSKVYDKTNDTFFGTVESVVDDSAATLSGDVSDDDIALVKTDAAFDFTNVNVGTRNVSGSGYSLSGSDATNYSLSQPLLSAQITAKTLTITANTDDAGNTRIYNATDDATTITDLVLTGFISGDETHVEATASAITFDDPVGVLRAKDVGSAKAITASGLALATPAGKISSLKDNYSLGGVSEVTTSADITQRPLTITPSPANTVSDNPARYEKIYDGQAAAEYEESGSVVEMVSCAGNSLGSDVVAVDCTDAAFGSKDVLRDGPGPLDEVLDKDITVSNISISGADALNYSLASTSLILTEAAILPKPLVASGFEANDKVYDGTRSATFNITLASLNGFVGSDDFVFTSLNGVFSGTDVSVSGGLVVDQNVRLTSWVFSGDSGVTSNYAIDINNSITQAKITPRNLPVTLSATDRVYNGQTTITLVASIDSNDLISRDRPQSDGDEYVVASATGSLPSKNVGTQTVSVSSVVLSGGDAGNRSNNYTPTHTAPSVTIAPKPLVWTVSAEDKAYDRTRDAGVELDDITDNRVSGDTFTVTFSSDLFDTADVGVNKTVEVGGLTISGGDAANYSAPSTATTTATITPVTITVSGTFTAATKVYDRTTTATVNDTSGLTLGDIILADQAGISIDSTTASFDDRSVGTSKSVTLDSLTVTGTNSGNYTVDVSGVSDYTAGEITPASLDVSVVVDDRNWDGTTNATIDRIDLSGVIGDDSVSVDTPNATAVFRTAEQGDDKPVDVSGIQLVQSGPWQNYVLTLTETAPGVYSAQTTADITGIPISLSITANDKSYDGTTAAIISVSFATVTGNTPVTPTYIGGAATFEQAQAGDNLLVTATGFRLTGDDANEYVLANTSATDRADIDALELGITAEDKVYDGTDEATVSLDGVIGSDDVSFASAPTASFDDPAGDARAKDVGANKAVTATSVSLAGDDRHNYTIDSTETTTATITQRLLTPRFTPNPAVSTAANPVSVDVNDDRITDDVLTVDFTEAATIRRGNQLVLVVSGISLSGVEADNYRVVTPYELVLRTFETPRSDRRVITQPEITPELTPFVAPRRAPAPSLPDARNVERPVAPNPVSPDSDSAGGLAPGSTPVVTGPSPDILPGWRPASSPRATIDFGEGVITRESSAREIAERIEVKPPSVLTATSFAGFEAGATTQLEIMGAKTLTTIEVNEQQMQNPQALRDALNAALESSGALSPGGLEGGVQILPLAESGDSRLPTGAELEVLEDALSWLGLPPVGSGPGVSQAERIADVVWQVEGFRPGSTVFLVVTSEPGLVAWGEANNAGVAILRGSLQADSLPEGEHSLRLIGTSVFDGAVANDEGFVNLAGDISPLIASFDRDTRISVALWGANPEGADHVTVRYIDPELEAPPSTLWWWLLLLPLLWLVIVLWRRRRGGWNSPAGRVGAASGAVVLASPAVIVGVVASQAPLVPAGLAAAVLVGVLAAVIPSAVGRDAGPGRRATAQA